MTPFRLSAVAARDGDCDLPPQVRRRVRSDRLRLRPGPGRRKDRRPRSGADLATAAATLVDVDRHETLVSREQRAARSRALDANLVGGTRLEVRGQIRAFKPRAVVVMLTAVAAESVVEQAVIGGASGYILKSDDLEQIAQGLRDAAATAFGGQPPRAP